MNQIVENLKMQLISKVKSGIPLCYMISMPIVRPTLFVDVKKIENSFQMGYKKGHIVFNVSTTKKQRSSRDGHFRVVQFIGHSLASKEWRV
jgi:hypothetical protein